MKRIPTQLFTVARIALALGVLLYLSVSGVINWAALGGLAVSWPLTLVAIAILVLNQLISAWRLCVLLRPRGFQLSLPASFRLTMVGAFFNVCLPGSVGGDVVRIYYATEGNEGRRAEVATIMVLDRAIGMLALLLWPLLVAPVFLSLLSANDSLRMLLLGAAGLAVAMIAVMLLGTLSAVRHSRLVEWTIARLPLGGCMAQVVDTIHDFRNHAGALVAALGISLLAHTTAVAVTLIVARAISVNGFAWSMAMLLPLGFLVNAVPFTPGGLGVGEAAFGHLFALAGLEGGPEVLLGWRIVLLIGSLVGLAYYIPGRQRWIHQADEASPAAELALQRSPRVA
jgi:uncharacterized protein (TIRG00374 family)